MNLEEGGNEIEATNPKYPCGGTYKDEVFNLFGPTKDLPFEFGSYLSLGICFQNLPYYAFILLPFITSLLSDSFE